MVLQARRGVVARECDSASCRPVLTIEAGASPLATACVCWPCAGRGGGSPSPEAAVPRTATAGARWLRPTVCTWRPDVVRPWCGPAGSVERRRR